MITIKNEPESIVANQMKVGDTAIVLDDIHNAGYGGHLLLCTRDGFVSLTKPVFEWGNECTLNVKPCDIEIEIK